jgi:DHA2 family multidrug resistance protein
VFLVNLPIGIIAFSMLLGLMPKSGIKIRPFDFFGFAMLALCVAAIQLLLDRGQQLGWFESMEVWIYLGLAISGFWVFVIHCLTAEHPFIDLAMFKDRNFTSGVIFIFVIGITLFSGLALLPPLLQNLMGYPVIETGIVMAPRGIGTMISMILVGRLVSKFDPRLLVFTGILLTLYSLYMMTQFDISMDSGPIIVSGVVQGLGLGLVFVPLTTLAFATIDTKYRVDATSMFNLVRNVGSGVGISMVTTVLAQMLQVNHSELAERITLNSQVVRDMLPKGDPSQVLSQLDGLVSQQSAMIAYLDDFQLMMYVTLLSIPIIFMLRRPKVTKVDPTHISE